MSDFLPDSCIHFKIVISSIERDGASNLAVCSGMIVMIEDTNMMKDY